VAGTFGRDTCTRCGTPMRQAAGESLVEGRNEWFVETYCPSCGSQWMECGRDLPEEPVRMLLIEQTGLWAATVDDAALGSAIMRALRRVYGGLLSDAKRQADQLRLEGMTGTRGELMLLAHQLGELGVHLTVTNQIPGSMDELPPRPAPTPPHHIGQPGAEPYPQIGRDAITVSERPRVAAYLRDAGCVVAGGALIDPVSRDPRDRWPDAVMTDGVHCWSLAWAYLVERYGAGLPTWFLEHIRALDYCPPQVSLERLMTVSIEEGLEPMANTDDRLVADFSEPQRTRDS
jgi:hypothetical protein